MRLSESLRRNIMDVGAGKIINRFKGPTRRNVLFFEDILACYVKECEDAGYGNEMMGIAQEWMNCMQEIIPDILKKAPMFLMNAVMRKVWINLGLMDDFRITKKNDIVNIRTKNEALTRLIGENKCLVGFYIGILNVLFSSGVECIKASQTKVSCNYIFRLKGSITVSSTNKKKIYSKLNRLPRLSGVTLKDVLKTNIFQLRNNNRLYFRGKSIWYVENTVFHILGNQGILLENIPGISYNYFKELVEKNTSVTKKIALLKTMLQSMGWGIVKIMRQKERIVFEMTHLPHGLQKGRDNWNVLINLIWGYLWLIDKDIKIEKVKETQNKITITYSA